jgi:hypothetical protein
MIVNRVLPPGSDGMKAHAIVISGLSSLLLLSGCIFGGNDRAGPEVIDEITGGANPYLWRASLDTLKDLPLESADPFGGTIIYDWTTYPDIPDERIKATVFILDSRLRADGVKVAVFRQVRVGEEWSDSAVDSSTSLQLENAILTRARNLRASQLED